MATITGTTDTDILIGTSGDDILLPYGVSRYGDADYMSGGDGADIYDLSKMTGSVSTHRYIIDDNGTDGAVDTITNVGALRYSESFGYLAFATAIRVGDDLQIVTPYKPNRFRSSSKPSFEITIKDHYDGEAVEFMIAGGITYALAAGFTGSEVADILAGTNSGDVLSGLGGDDFITGNGGHDVMHGGAGDDQIFGGTGRDTMNGDAGNDTIYGGKGKDTVDGGDGNDRIFLENGNDIGRGGASNDTIFGQDGNDRLYGGAGNDRLSGGRGNDKMFGGADGDTYVFGYDVDNLSIMDDPGHDTIKDKGERPTWGNQDIIEIYGIYGPSSGGIEEYDRMSFSREGLDMLIQIDGGAASITVLNQFKAKKFAIEDVVFNAGYWTAQQFKVLDGQYVDIGDDRAYANGMGGEFNEVIFGTDGDDQVFGDSGTNFIWLGAGADTLIYKESDPELWYGLGGGAVNDIVEDFDVTQDLLDFTEIKGLGYGNLSITEDAEGDAHITWYSGDFEVSNIFIELRGVSASEVTADLFVFG